MVQETVPLTSRTIGYADDLCAMLNVNSRDVRELERVITELGFISGLKLNQTKTVLCCLSDSWENIPAT